MFHGYVPWRSNLFDLSQQARNICCCMVTSHQAMLNSSS